MKRAVSILLALVLFLSIIPPAQASALDLDLAGNAEGTYCIDRDSVSGQNSEGKVRIDGRYYTYYTGWRYLFDNWYYFDPDYGYMWSGLMFDYNGNKYILDEYGRMQTGWIKNEFYYEEEKVPTVWWYYAYDNGVLASGWNKINGVWYYFDPDDRFMYADTIFDTGTKAYAFDTSGAMKTGWVKVENNYRGYIWYTWMYADSNGVLQTGWQKINGVWYYFDEYTYEMCEDDSYQINGKIWLFNKNGSLVSSEGWVKLSDYWYYANSDGTAFIGWKNINGNWYYMKPRWGIMEDCACVVDGILYTFNSNGVYTGKVTTPGWHKFCYYWFYVGANGKAATGWLNYNGNWYYLDDLGRMVMGDYMIGDKIYFFNENGALISKEGWQCVGYEDGEVDWYYVDSNGVCRKGWQKINGVWYYFDEYLAYMYADGLYWIGETQYMFNEKGAWVG